MIFQRRLQRKLLLIARNGPFYYRPQLVKIAENDYLWKRAPQDYCQGICLFSIKVQSLEKKLLFSYRKFKFCQLHKSIHRCTICCGFGYHSIRDKYWSESVLKRK